MQAQPNKPASSGPASFTSDIEYLLMRANRDHERLAWYTEEKRTSIRAAMADVVECIFWCFRYLSAAVIREPPVSIMSIQVSALIGPRLSNIIGRNNCAIVPLTFVQPQLPEFRQVT